MKKKLKYVIVRTYSAGVFAGHLMKMPLLFMISMFAGCDNVEPNRQPKPADLPMRKTEYSTNSIIATNAPGSVAFMGGLPLPDGCVLFMPNNSTPVRIYNSVTDTLSTPIGTHTGSSSFQGGVLLLDGRVLCMSCNSTSALIYNPVTDTLSTPIWCDLERELATIVPRLNAEWQAKLEAMTAHAKAERARTNNE